MNIFIVENDATADTLLASSQYVAGRDLVVCFNYLPLLCMQRSDGVHRVRFIEDFFTPDSYRDLHEIVDSFARDWYRMGSDDATAFEGMSYGEITEIMLTRQYMLGVLVKYGEALRLFIQSCPGAQTLYSDLSNEANSFFLLCG